MKKIILIPVYNDWKSLNLLINQIKEKNKSLKNLEILIIDDASTIKPFLKKKSIFKKIKILSLNKNVGSQKAISIGLDYLKKNENNFIVVIMDGDGEDNPAHLNTMLNLAINNKNYVVTSHRKKRNENTFIKIGYKVHLFISYFFTWHWISFGNFSAFHSKNLNKINLKKTWLAYPSSILQDCKIIKVFATRQKRYFGKSKVSLLKLIEHSLRIISVFYKRVLITSAIILLFCLILNNNFILIYATIFLFNIIIFFVFHKNKTNNINYRQYLKFIKSF